MGLIYTNSKSKVKAKLKPKSERDEYAAWCAKYGIDPTGKTRKRKTKEPTVTISFSKSYVRETAKPPSLNSHVTGPVNTGGRGKQVYTGDKMLGIAAMHKSNLVPIFSENDAVEVSTMRRN